jgi:hypothetical protein
VGVAVGVATADVDGVGVAGGPVGVTTTVAVAAGTTVAGGVGEATSTIAVSSLPLGRMTPPTYASPALTAITATTSGMYRKFVGRA